MSDYRDEHEWATEDFWMVCPSRIVDKYSAFGPPSGDAGAQVQPIALTERMLTEQFDEHYVIDDEFDEDPKSFTIEGE